MKTRYYYVIEDRDTKEVSNMICYHIDKTQSEMDEIILDFNQRKDGAHEHKQVVAEPMLSLVKKALEWKHTKTLEDISIALEVISRSVDDARYEIDFFMREQGKTNSTQDSRGEK